MDFYRSQEIISVCFWLLKTSERQISHPAQIRRSSSSVFIQKMKKIATKKQQ
ncbi:MAG: hypothetical protein K8S27_06305 [Candidatus Omnitrophica bacterium]|nr:hypothetical protein [Candidatus Omnitrophota bacterium]